MARPPSKKGLTTEERDEAVIREFVRRRPKAHIAATYKIDVTTVTAIIDRWRSTRPKLSKRDPVEIVEDMLSEYEAAMDDLGEIGHNATQDTAKVGAIRQRMACMREMREL